MASKKDTPEKAPEAPSSRVASGPALTLPQPAARREPVSVGVTRVRVSNDPRREGEQYVTAAGFAGAPFGVWAVATHGVRERERREPAGWADLYKQFTARPIHGHRRGPLGGNHKPSR